MTLASYGTTGSVSMCPFGDDRFLKRHSAATETFTARWLFVSAVAQYCWIVASAGHFAPVVIDRALNGEWFLVYVEQHLISGGILLMDNLNRYKLADVRTTLAAVYCTLVLLLPHGPDLNPSTLAFSECRTLLQKCPEGTIEFPWNRFDRLMSELSPQECPNDIRHCAYTAH